MNLKGCKSNIHSHAMFSSRHGARTSATAAGRFALPASCPEKRAASPSTDVFKRARNDAQPSAPLDSQPSIGVELFGMSSSQLLLDIPLLSDDLFKTNSPCIQRQSTGERVRLELAQLYEDFTADQPSRTVVESPLASPPHSTPAPTVEELISMSMHKPGYSAVRPRSPVLGMPVTQPVVAPPSHAPAPPTGYVWTPATATGAYTGGAWPQHFAVTAQMVPVQQTQHAPVGVAAPVQQDLVPMSFSLGAVQQVESPFAAYSVQQQVVQQIEEPQLAVGPVTTPAYTPVGRMRGDGADSFFVEPAFENMHSNKAVMRVLGTGSDQEVCELWNMCIHSPGTEHSCKQAVDVALHMRCACHLLVSGMAKSYVDVCRQLGMLADRKCLNGCEHKHACQVGTFYCISCVRGDKHELDVEQCLEKWLAAGSPIRHGQRV